MVTRRKEVHPVMALSTVLLRNIVSGRDYRDRMAGDVSEGFLVIDDDEVFEVRL